MKRAWRGVGQMIDAERIHASVPDRGAVGAPALSGLRVVDLSRVLAGPYCTQMLGDHGAEVIKVEPPSGDLTRAWGPIGRDGISAYYAGLNRNKSHLCLDLSCAAGQRIARRLLDDADVVVENFKPGTLERWNLAPQDLLQRNPRLVVIRISAFGTSGPMAGLPGYDAVLQAFSGMMALNGEPHGDPMRLPMPIVDLTAAMLAFSGTLLALQARHSTGRGQVVDLSLLDSALSLMHPSAATYLGDGSPPRRMGAAHPSVAPYETFETTTGPVFIAGGNDAQFRRLCAHLGIDHASDDPRFATNASRLRHRLELHTLLQEAIGRRDAEAITRELLAIEVPASAVRDLPDVLSDEQVLLNDMVATAGDFRVLGVPIKMQETPASIRTGPQRLGADTAEVLEALGYTEEQTRELTSRGVVRIGPVA